MSCETWTSTEARRIAGVTYRQLDYWLRARLARASKPARGSGTRRAFAYRDLVALRAIAGLKALGVSLQAIRKVQRALLAFEGTDEALRAGRLVVEQGRGGPDVAVAVDDDAVLSLLHKPGQTIARTIYDLEPVYAHVDAGVERIAAEREKKAAKRQKGRAATCRTRGCELGVMA